MKGKKLLYKTAGMAAALLSLSLFSCSSDGTLDYFGKSQTDCIRFGISDDDNATRANGNGEDVTSVIVPERRTAAVSGGAVVPNRELSVS